MGETEKKIEQEIQARGLNAPRLTPDLIDSKIKATYAGRATDLFGDCPVLPELGCLTIAVIVLENGFTVVGHSACASPENYDEELGIKIALENAREQIWPLEGYLLKEALHQKSGA